MTHAGALLMFNSKFANFINIFKMMDSLFAVATKFSDMGAPMHDQQDHTKFYFVLNNIYFNS